MKRMFLLALSAITLSTLSMAQGSPAKTTTGSINGANITINYSSPSVKGRQIWGGLVPYDKVWRAGANLATVIETDKALKIEGKDLPAGKYSIYALPGANVWTIIFNSATGQWGITRQGETTLDPSKDVLRVKVKPVKVDALQEALSYDIDPNGIALRWENLKVPVSIK